MLFVLLDHFRQFGPFWPFLVLVVALSWIILTFLFFALFGLFWLSDGLFLAFYLVGSFRVVGAILTLFWAFLLFNNLRKTINLSIKQNFKTVMEKLIFYISFVKGFVYNLTR